MTFESCDLYRCCDKFKYSLRCWRELTYLMDINSTPFIGIKTENRINREKKKRIPQKCSSIAEKLVYNEFPHQYESPLFVIMVRVNFPVTIFHTSWTEECGFSSTKTALICIQKHHTLWYQAVLTVIKMCVQLIVQ